MTERRFGGLTIDELRKYRWLSASVAYEILYEVERLVAALDRYGSHVHAGPIDSVCDLTVMDAFEPGPPRRFKVRGVWRDETPVCTCGLDAALAGEEVTNG